MEITTVEELKAVQSMMGSLQYEFSKLGNDGRESRRLAAQKIGETYTPPLSAEEMESAIGKARATLHGDKRNAAIRSFYQEKHASENETEVEERGATYTQLYRQWCDENKHVAADVELAHFTGGTPAAFSFCRKKLINDGYVFEKNGHGWNVTCPVVERTYTEKEVRAMMEDLLGKFGKNG